MKVEQREIVIATREVPDLTLKSIAKSVYSRLKPGEIPIRFCVTESDELYVRCEINLLTGESLWPGLDAQKPTEFVGPVQDIFALNPITNHEPNGRGPGSAFNVVLVVPTGIGCEIGGHAGDATPVSRMLAGVCDTLITHPNVVNASDINEMTPNTLYVEGSVICRLLLGQVGLRLVRSNRLLVVVSKHEDERFVNDAINSVSAARSSFGLSCPKMVVLDPPVLMRGGHTESGLAWGCVDQLDGLFEVLSRYRNSYDAVALASVIDVPVEYHAGYFESAGDMVNPWGGVEAMLTHAVSAICCVPSAHAPMLESLEIENLELGIVDPRMAAEAVSSTFFHCVLKGLHRSPQLVPGTYDVSCLVIPDGCIGIPTLAALEQGIPVVAVRENRNLMKNDLTRLPWRPGQLHVVDNYWEAVGVVTALREGIAPESVRRPLKATQVVRN